MSGVFSKSNRPPRPGAYVNFIAIQQAVTPPGLSGIVCVPFTSDWGPSEVPVMLETMDDYRAVFGDSTNTVGYRDVYQAFLGEGVSADFGGAGAVLAYRMSGSTAAKASHSFTNTTPVSALTLTAVYEGTRGNALNVTIQAAAGIANTDQLLIYDGTTLVETYNFLHTATDVVALAAAINAASHWVTAASVVSGVALTYVANAALTGGLGGETLLLADWTAMFSAIETQRFSYLVAEWPVDAPTYAALLAWVIAKRASGKMFRVVVGGALNETSTVAIARSATFNHEAFVNIGQGSVQDSVFGVLSSAMLAPRIAGALASRGESKSLTYARFVNFTMLVGASDTEIVAGFQGGLVTLARDSNAAAPVRVEKGVTTYTTTTNSTKPYLIYRNPKFIATMDGIQMDLQTFAEQNVVGKLPVGGATRSYVRNYINQLLTQRERLGVIQPGWTVADDFNPVATPQDEFMQFEIGITFGRSTEQVYFTASVG